MTGTPVLRRAPSARTTAKTFTASMLVVVIAGLVVAGPAGGGAGPDADGDGVYDGVDLCADTDIPETVIPTEGTLKRNRYAMVDGDEFFDRGGRPGDTRYSIHDTAGCNAGQIADQMGYGKGAYRRGLGNSQMKKWVAAAQDMVDPLVLAIAYSDLDGTNDYAPGGEDVLISKLVDSNGDGLPSIGDSVTTGRYPVNFEGTAFGNFGDNEHTVSAIRELSATKIAVEVDGDEDSTIWWQSIGVQDNYYETTGPACGTCLRDGHDGIDTVFVIDPEHSPSEPDTFIGNEAELLRTDVGDDDFLEVEIYNEGR